MVRETKLIMRPKRLYGFLLLNIAIPRDRSTSWGLAPMKWMSKSWPDWNYLSHEPQRFVSLALFLPCSTRCVCCLPYSQAAGSLHFMVPCASFTFIAAQGFFLPIPDVARRWSTLSSSSSWNYKDSLAFVLLPLISLQMSEALSAYSGLSAQAQFSISFAKTSPLALIRQPVGLHFRRGPRQRWSPPRAIALNPSCAPPRPCHEYSKFCWIFAQIVLLYEFLEPVRFYSH